MTDISTIWSTDLARGDWSTGAAGGDLLSGDDLATAVLISLFTDATAGDDDAIPDGTDDPRGWWADPIGSKLWLRVRAKRTDDLLAIVKDDIQTALRWLIDDGVASAVDVAVEWQVPARLACQIVIHRASGDTSLRFAWAWGD